MEGHQVQQAPCALHKQGKCKGTQRRNQHQQGRKDNEEGRKADSSRQDQHRVFQTERRQLRPNHQRNQGAFVITHSVLTAPVRLCNSA